MATIPPNQHHHHHHHHIPLYADTMRSGSSSTSASVSTSSSSLPSAPSSIPSSTSSLSSASPAMAAAGAKAKSAKSVAASAAASAPTTSSAASSATKTKTQMHRRSRTGCYTCRLRRKKCDEGTPMCSACKHLGLTCQYKRPGWWGNNDARRKQKEDIKVTIKQKKMSEKAARPLPGAAVPLPATLPMNMQVPMSMSMASMPLPSSSSSSSSSSPPLLSHSLPPSATFSSDPLDRNRSASIDSHYSTGMPVMAVDFNAAGFSSPPDFISFGGAPAGFCNADMLFNAPAGFSPYEVDVKTERQMFVNDVPTMRESTVSTFSTFTTPPPVGSVLGADWDAATPSHMFTSETTTTSEALSEEALNCNFFDFGHHSDGLLRSGSSLAVEIELDENDQVLLDHFVQAVLPTLFPILNSNQHASPATDVILPALQGNKCYLHCCLSVAAQHLRATQGANPELDEAVMHHRYQTVSMLCRALGQEEAHSEILDVTLALIFFQCVVGTIDESLQDIPWHQHVQAAVSVAQQLPLALPLPGPAPALSAEASAAAAAASAAAAGSDEPIDPLDTSCLASSTAASQASQTATTTPFNMTLMSWIDIMGATMKGRAPSFAHMYREKHLAHPESSLGLRELMGCDDRVMYLISEIACLEALKAEGMDDITICTHVQALGDQITLTEQADAAAQLHTGPKSPYTASGSLSPKQLSRNVTAAFRLAARIYLCSLVPGFSPSQASCIGLVDKLTNVLQFIPPGYDRSLAWVYLVAGSVALPGSSFRSVFDQRMRDMGDQAALGAIGQVITVLHEVWGQIAAAMVAQTGDSVPYIHWRDVMAAQGWDLLIM